MAEIGVGGLSEDQLDQFGRDGFLAIEGLLGDEDLAQVYDEYEQVLAGRMDRLLATGALAERPGGGFGECYAAVLAADALSHRSRSWRRSPTFRRRSSKAWRSGRCRCGEGAWCCSTS